MAVMAGAKKADLRRYACRGIDEGLGKLEGKGRLMGVPGWLPCSQRPADLMVACEEATCSMRPAQDCESG